MVKIISDPTGFPLVEVPELALYAHLLPVTKVQFEEWLLLPDTPGNRFYDEAQNIHLLNNPPKDGARRSVPQINKRVSWRECTNENYERLFMTGILVREAERFARWLGPRYDLPTVEEWRTIAENWERCLSLREFQTANPLARHIVDKLYEITHPQTLLAQSLMTNIKTNKGRFGGVMEWVRQGHEAVWLGQPRTDFYGNTFDPLRDPPLRPTSEADRYIFVGFRLVLRSK